MSYRRDDFGRLELMAGPTVGGAGVSYRYDARANVVSRQSWDLATVPEVHFLAGPWFSHAGVQIGPSSGDHVCWPRLRSWPAEWGAPSRAPSPSLRGSPPSSPRPPRSRPRAPRLRRTAPPASRRTRAVRPTRSPQDSPLPRRGSRQRPPSTRRPSSARPLPVLAWQPRAEREPAQCGGLRARSRSVPRARSYPPPRESATGVPTQASTRS